MSSGAGGRPGWYVAKAAISEISSVSGNVSASLMYVPPVGFDATIAKLYKGVGVVVGVRVRDGVGVCDVVEYAVVDRVFVALIEGGSHIGVVLLSSILRMRLLPCLLGG